MEIILEYIVFFYRDLVINNSVLFEDIWVIFIDMSTLKHDCIFMLQRTINFINLYIRTHVNQNEFQEKFEFISIFHGFFFQ